MSSTEIRLQTTALRQEFISDRVVAQIYGVGERTIRRWAQRGEIPKGRRIGGRRLWRLADIERDIAQSPEGVQA